MKFVLPECHGLPDAVVASEFVTRNDDVSLTDVQFDALVSGVARGLNLLVAAPTSSGKTGVAVFAISGWIAEHQIGRAKAVYLLSHRALAREKFFEFRDRLAPLLGLDKADVVFAIGDVLMDGNGDDPSDPLTAPILVATYEKYLGLLSASGTPSDLSDTCFIFDELQIIGEEGRGQDVEILLTLVRRARAGQLVGLCAVLDPADGRDMSEWLDAREIRIDNREVELVYELRLSDETIRVSTRSPENIQTLPGAATDTISVLQELMQNSNRYAPIAVFCTVRNDVLELARRWDSLTGLSAPRQMALVFDEETSSSRELTSYLPRAFGFHTADLIELEREAVEQSLRNDHLQVVFATTTLAYGLNFSFKTVLIHSWERFRTPISAAEFHNMAGRAGRLGLADVGRVIFKSSVREKRRAASYLNISRVDRLDSRIRPERFDQLALQLLSSGMAIDRDSLVEFLAGTMSAVRERRRNLTLDQQWASSVDLALEQLKRWGFINSRLDLTPVGRRVAVSGLLPKTTHQLLEYLNRVAEQLTLMLGEGRERQGGHPQAEDVEFALMHACLCSADFTRTQGGKRNLPRQIDGRRDSERGRRMDGLLVHSPWHETGPMVNGADIAADWILGRPMADLEARFERLRGGDLSRMFNDLRQMLSGLADVALAATAPSLRLEDRVPSIPDPDNVRDNIRMITSMMRTCAARLGQGLPKDVLWLADLFDANGASILSRPAIVRLTRTHFVRPEGLLDNLLKSELITTLRPVYGAQKAPERVDVLRNAVERHRAAGTQRKRESQLRRAGVDWEDILQRIYTAPGTAFETALNDAFEKIGITVVARDDLSKQSFPDFVLNLPPVGTVVVECKTKQPPNVCVDLTTVTAVCGKASTHGFDHDYKVTICRPYVSPDVGRTLNSKRLAAVNCEDFIEALVRIATGRAPLENLADWLAQPGHIVIDSFVNTPRPPNVHAEHSA